MTIDMVWSGLLTMGFGVLGWIIKGYIDEMKRITILLNRTREEMAKEYVTKVDVHLDMDRVIDRLDRMDAKLDAFMKEQRSAIN